MKEDTRAFYVFQIVPAAAAAFKLLWRGITTGEVKGPFYRDEFFFSGARARVRESIR